MPDDFDSFDDLESFEIEEPIDFNEVMDAFLDDTITFPPRFLYRLSGLEGLELEQFIETWPQASQTRRERLLEDLEALAIETYHLDYDQVFMLGLQETSAHIRQLAIRALWDCPEGALISRFTDMLLNDPENDVRAAAARGLGKFIYLAEVEEIDDAFATTIPNQMIDIFDAAAEGIQRGIIESLGFCSTVDADKHIQSAFEKDREDWLVSALVAAGRSAGQYWIPQVIENLNHEAAEVRLAAVESAGLMGAQGAMPHLLHLIDDPEEDVKFAAIWSLSEIGGLDARAALEALLKNTEDEDEIELIGEALENLNFTEMTLNFDLFDLSEDDLNDMLDDSKI
ncbi:MAG: HEAT repeat domain-containing protein [Anaerolineales bacterium]|nr:HEAT repeat domain-containing protein [Anaerolineales bacterium]